MSGRKPRLAFLRIGVRSVLRGEISAGVAAREYLRRGRVALVRRRERASLDELRSKPAHLLPHFQNLSPAELLKHFRERKKPSFLPGFATPIATGQLQRKLFPKETQTLIGSANQITRIQSVVLKNPGQQ